jgi:hypothetical protein
MLSSFAPLVWKCNVDQGVDEDYNLDIFELTANTNELMKELVSQELLIFTRFQLDIKDIECFFQWWEKHEFMFPTVGFLAY